MIKARILGHDGQVLARLEIKEKLPYLRVALPSKITAHSLNETDPSVLEPPKEGIAYYERTDGGGTRIYRLRVKL